MLYAWVTLFVLCHGNAFPSNDPHAVLYDTYQCLNQWTNECIHTLLPHDNPSTTLSEAGGFLIHNTHHSLCLEDQAGPGPGPGAVGLGRCNLDSQLQQWVWWNRRVLKNLGSDRCLASRGTDPVRTVGCQALEEEQEEEEEEMLWDCESSRLVSVSSGLELSVDDDGLSPALSALSQRSGRWRSLDEGDICQEILSESCLSI